MAKFRAETGAYLTNQTRSLVLEERWEDALHFLKEALSCPLDIAVEVASGKTKLLSQDDGVETFPEEESVRLEHEKSVASLYRGRVTHSVGGSRIWIRPVAYVSNVGAWDVTEVPLWQVSDLDDLRRAAVEAMGCHTKPDGINNRARFYCRHPGELYLGPCNSLPLEFAQVIWEKCSSAPMWRRQSKILSMALFDFQTHGGILEERGWVQFCEEHSLL
jgi:hypothetical protein